MRVWRTSSSYKIAAEAIAQEKGRTASINEVESGKRNRYKQRNTQSLHA